jgi:hypothetical protein
VLDLVLFIIPAQAGIHRFCLLADKLDPGLRRGDGPWIPDFDE